MYALNLQSDVEWLEVEAFIYCTEVKFAINSDIQSADLCNDL